MTRNIDWSEVTEDPPTAQDYVLKLQAEAEKQTRQRDEKRKRRQPFCDMVGNNKYFDTLESQICETRSHLEYVQSKLKTLENRLLESDDIAELLFNESQMIKAS